MKGLLAIIALGAIALMVNGASAQAGSPRRAHSQTHARQMPSRFANDYGYASQPLSQGQALSGRYQNMYESDSLGRQSFANPDRVLPVPDHE